MCYFHSNHHRRFQTTNRRVFEIKISFRKVTLTSIIFETNHENFLIDRGELSVWIHLRWNYGRPKTFLSLGCLASPGIWGIVMKNTSQIARKSITKHQECLEMMFEHIWKLGSTQMVENSSFKSLHTFGPNRLQNCPYLSGNQRLLCRFLTIC